MAGASGWCESGGGAQPRAWRSGVRPHVVGDATELLESKGVADCVTIDPGHFVERVIEGGDVYVLSHIIDDWNEDQCLTIFGWCRPRRR